MLSHFIKLMKNEGIADSVIRTFSAYYQELEKGERGLVGKDMITPPSPQNVVNYDDISELRNQGILKNIAMIKLNGGLGTSMGLSKAKSLLPVKGNMTFLDIIVRQILALRARTGYDIQLLFMNSYSTEKDTLDYLKKYPDLTRSDLPLSFMQNKFPRIRQDDLKPFESKDKQQMWNPPGHGDIYAALCVSGLLDKLIDRGYRYAFVSNSDNLGATIDTAIPAFMEKQGIQFLMEVCKRSETDKKGGHLCEDKHSQLMLREIAQCPPEEMEDFQDIEHYKYFNTNNLWIDLKALQWNLIAGDGIMLLPLIINPKNVEDTPVYQLETAMGAAIGAFGKSMALLVPRQRFAPVKKNTDLLAIWSDVYELNDQYQIQLRRGLSSPPSIDLDENFYGSIDQLLERFKDGVPSLIDCKSLKLEGDISFGDDVICEGRVSIIAGEKIHLKSRLLAGDIRY
ncbi:MAG: UTP--glucose-1-phosphate uridylyltransferase [Candidatus Cloacimonadaceae bacterium]|nr:UTP--glucose-1-phosphate uridylyltransferase [Candidatus Cloacimonadaceae bacterium]